MLLAWAIIATLMLFGMSWFCVSITKKNLELSDQREDLVTQIEESLDMLDGCYSRLAHHSQIPVLSDEPIIQEVVHDMRLARNAVLAIASKVVTYGSDDEEPGER